MSIQIHCFGRTRVSVADQVVRLTPHARVLLAILDVECVRRLTRSQLIDLIWESDPSADRRHSLSQLIYELRRSLGKGAVRSDGPYLRAHGTESDFRRAIAAQAWIEVEGFLSAGDFLADAPLEHETFTDWKAGKIAMLYRHAIATGHSELANARDRLDWNRALAISEAMLRCDIYDENAWIGKIEAIVADGDIARAAGELASVRMLYRDDLSQPLPTSLNSILERVSELQTISVPLNSDSHDIPFVGRVEELGFIRGKCRRSRTQGVSELIIVQGGPGIGKTRLIDRSVRSEILAGSASIQVNAEERTYLDPFAAVRQLVHSCTRRDLRALPPEWHDFALALADSTHAPEQEQKPAAVNEVCYRVIRAIAGRNQGLIIVIDDLQWVDRASIAAFEHAMQRTAGLSITWILATRPEGAPTVLRLEERWRQFQRASANALLLEPLSTDSVVHLLEQISIKHQVDATSWEREALAYSSGNPLLLRFWLSYKMRGGDPGGDIAEFAATRFTSDEQFVALSLAVLGGRAGIALLGEVSAVSKEVLEQAVAHFERVGWMRSSPVAVQFTHDIIRERFLCSMRDEDIQRVHRRALAVLTRSSRRSTVLLAHHAIGSGDASSATRYALLAAEECIRMGAQDEAESFLKQAVDSAPTECAHTEALHALGQFYITVDKIREAEQCFRVSGPFTHVLPDAVFYRRYVTLRMDLLALSEDAVTLVQRAVELLRDMPAIGKIDLMCQAISIAVEVAHDCGRSEVIRAAVLDIESVFPTCDSRNQAFLAGLLSRTHAVYGELRQAKTWAQRALDAANDAKDELAILRAVIAEATADMVAGHVRSALASFEKALTISRSPRCFYYQQRILNNYGVALIEGDQLDRARDMLTYGLTTAMGHDRLFLLGNLAHVELLLGKPEEAARLVSHLRALNSTFSAEWAEVFCDSVLRAVHGDGWGPSVQIVEDRIYNMHELTLQQALQNLYGVDRTAGVAAAVTIIRALKGRDFLRRARIRVLQLSKEEQTARSASRLRRLSQWVRRRGANRLAAEIEQHLRYS